MTTAAGGSELDEAEPSRVEPRSEIAVNRRTFLQSVLQPSETMPGTPVEAAVDAMADGRHVIDSNFLSFFSVYFCFERFRGPIIKQQTEASS